MTYLVVIEKGSSSFGAYMPDLPGCVAVGDTRDDATRLIELNRSSTAGRKLERELYRHAKGRKLISMVRMPCPSQPAQRPAPVLKLNLFGA